MTPKEKAAAAKAQALAAGKTSKEAEAAAEKASKGTARRKGAWSHVFKGMEIFNVIEATDREVSQIKACKK